MSANVFSAWLDPVERFRAEVLGRRPFFLAAQGERARSVASLSPTWDAVELAGQATDLMAWFHTLNGQMRMAPVAPKTAGSLYEAGLTLYLRSVPLLEPILEDAARAFCRSREKLQCGLFCNKPNARSRMHFDALETLTIQVKGVKEWRVAKNTHTPEPSANWVTLNDVPDELRRYAYGELPGTMPTDAQTYRLEPGAVLYVPRGYWHETASSEESVSIHLHLLAYTWVDALTTMLRTQLVRSERLRGHAYGLLDPAATAEGDVTPEEAVSALKEVVTRLSASDLSARVEPEVGSDDAVVRRAMTTIKIEPCPDDPAQKSVTLHAEGHDGDARVTTLDMTEDLVAACIAIADAPFAQTPRDLQERFGLAAGDAVDLVRLMQRAGFVRRR